MDSNVFLELVLILLDGSRRVLLERENQAIVRGGVRRALSLSKDYEHVPYLT
jgi:hypothetical protein